MTQTSKAPFKPDWLSLREPADHAARDAALLAKAAACLSSHHKVLDLGSGTGSTARAFAAHGFEALSWRFLDDDAGLLNIAKDRHQDAECVCMSLAELERLPLQDVGLVTASALLDLMSDDWVRSLARTLYEKAIPLYAALSYNDVMQWDPAHEADTAVTQAFNRHQRSDKGLGPALGGNAGERTAQIFREEGFDVTLANSPWSLGPDQAELHSELLVGIGAASAEAGETKALAWTETRQSAVSHSRVVIGHTDLIALPTLEH